MKSRAISFKLTEELYKKLKAVTDKTRNPYAPSLTQMLERGIELALKELEGKR